MGHLKQGVKHARKISTKQIRKDAERPFSLMLVGADEEDRAALARLFVPERLGIGERDRALSGLNSELAVSGWQGISASNSDVYVFTPRAAAILGEHAREGVIVDYHDPKVGFEELLRRYPDFRLSLGRAFPFLRELVADHLLRAVAIRNATFAGLSAVPEIFPTPLSLVWAVGGFASDSVVLTANQLKLAFELAALYGENPGWLAQRSQVISIVAAAFGWRALARGLVGIIPAGAGLVAKMGIAYGASVAVGRALWRHQRDNQAFPPVPGYEYLPESKAS